MGRIEGKSADTKYCRPFSHLQSEVPEQRAKLLFLNHLLCKSDHLFEFLAFILHLEMLSLSRKIGNLKVSRFFEGGTSQKSSLCNASDSL